MHLFEHRLQGVNAVISAAYYLFCLTFGVVVFVGHQYFPSWLAIALVIDVLVGIGLGILGHTGLLFYRIFTKHLPSNTLVESTKEFWKSNLWLALIIFPFMVLLLAGTSDQTEHFTSFPAMLLVVIGVKQLLSVWPWQRRIPEIPKFYEAVENCISSFALALIIAIVFFVSHYVAGIIAFVFESSALAKTDYFFTGVTYLLCYLCMVFYYAYEGFRQFKVYRQSKHRAGEAG